MRRNASLSAVVLVMSSCADGGAADAPDVTPTSSGDSGLTEVTVTETSAPDTSAPDTSTTDTSARPVGTGLGEVLPDFTLRTCAGEPFQLHATHAADTTFVHLFAGWCPPCQSDAAATPDDFERLAAIGPTLEWLFVITEDNGGEPPSLAYCQAVADDLDLPAGVRVLADVDGTFPSHLGLASPNAWGLVLDEDGALSFSKKYGYGAAVEHAADRLAR